MKTFMPDNAGPCAKRVVNAVLVMPNGERYASSNFCMQPQTACPRAAAGYEAGAGYHLCEEICEQPAHAEVNVLRWAAFNEGRDTRGVRIDNPLRGANVYVDHTWVCANCNSAVNRAGCKVHTGAAPAENNEHAQRQWGAYQESRRIMLGSD